MIRKPRLQAACKRGFVINVGNKPYSRQQGDVKCDGCAFRTQ